MGRVIISVGIFFLLITTASAICDLDASLVNQDPYPAIPGEYVKVVFQLTGLENPDCEGAIFDLDLKYPFSSDEPTEKVLPGTTYAYNYSSIWLLPYKLRIDKDALEGANKLEVKYKPGTDKSSSFYIKESFDIEVEDVRTDFEVYIKDYDEDTGTMTFEILNIGDNDVEALTVEIPEQENITVKGSSTTILGSLDSNEDTTFDFKVVPKKGYIKLKILYTDTINERRSLEKSVYFNPENFKKQKKFPFWTIAPTIILLLILIWILIRRRKLRKKS